MVKLTKKQLEQYPEYSCSVPTGIRKGKVWRRGEPYTNKTDWYLGQYIDDNGTIAWNKVILLEETT